CNAGSTWPPWMREGGTSCASASSRTIESSPPLTATRMRRPASGPASQPPTASRTAEASGSGAGLLELAIREQALLALGDQFLGPQALDLAQGIGDRPPQGLRHRIDIAMRPADGFADHAIDQAERFQALRGDAERRRGFRSLV